MRSLGREFALRFIKSITGYIIGDDEQMIERSLERFYQPCYLISFELIVGLCTCFFHCICPKTCSYKIFCFCKKESYFSNAA